ncbi:MAG: hypothetical protein VX899_08010 [Myxococcota bacterium]|nr:hypothetical protein [Myxococcota bacterium]
MSESTEISSLDALREALAEDRVRAAVRRRIYGDGLTSAGEALERHRDAIETCEALEPVVVEVRSTLDTHDLQELGRKLKILRTKGGSLAEESTSERLLGSGTVLGAVADLVRDTSSVLQRGWKARLADEFNTIGELGKALHQMDSQSDLAARMQQVSLEGVGLGLAFPPDESALEALKRGIEARDALLAELSSGRSNLGEFLLKVARGTATLADVDDQVRDWLEERGALGRFSIRL